MFVPGERGASLFVRVCSRKIVLNYSRKPNNNDGKLVYIYIYIYIYRERERYSGKRSRNAMLCYAMPADGDHPPLAYL